MRLSVEKQGGRAFIVHEYWLRRIKVGLRKEVGGGGGGSGFNSIKIGTNDGLL
jgi:hypothetical protein